MEVLGSSENASSFVATQIVLQALSVIRAEVDVTSIAIEALCTVFEPAPYVPGPEAVWTLKPDWTNGVTERLHFLTDVLPSMTGVEQRRKVRQWPRRDIEADYTLFRERRRFYDSLMKGPSNNFFRVPLWWDKFVLTAEAIAGDSTLTANIANGEWNLGAYIMILGDTPWTYEIVRVRALSSDLNGLILSNTLQYTWPAGTVFYITKLCRLASAASSGNRKSDEAYQVTLTFETTEINGYFPVAPSVNIGEPVWIDFPDDSNDLTSSYERLYAEFDNKSGLISRRDLGQTAFRISQFAHWLYGRGQMNDFRQFMYYLSGKLRPVYVPTNFNDMKFLSYATMQVTDSAIFIDRTGYSELVFEYPTNTPGRDVVCIFWTDGTYDLYTVLLAALISPTIECILFTTQLGRTVTASSIRRISFLELSRLDTDDIEILHQSDTTGVATVVTSWRAIGTEVQRYDPEYDIAYTGSYVPDANPPVLPTPYYQPQPAPDPAPPVVTDNVQQGGTGEGNGGDSAGGDNGDGANAGGDDGSDGNGGGDSGGGGGP
jgi:uncharacterized membrane protein YgcG